MARNLYVTALEAGSGKSVVTLGTADLLSRRVERLGIFRPIIRPGDSHDDDLQMFRRRYCAALEYESLYGVKHYEARELVAAGQQGELLKRILDRYKALEHRCDFVLCQGTDFTSLASAFEFELNAQIANHLGCAVLPVVLGSNKPIAEIHDSVRFAREGFTEAGCLPAAFIVNRVAVQDVDELRRRFAAWPYPEPVYVLPEQAALARPTFGEIVAGLGARLWQGSADALARETLDFKIAAMQVEHFLDHVGQGACVITPGDRSDIVLASLALGHPTISGILLTGGLAVPPSVARLIEGLGQTDIAIAEVPDDTFTAATKVRTVRSAIGSASERKITTALSLFEKGVNLADLERQIDVARATCVTPLMFEYQMVQRAKAHRKHVVLPEGDEERILRAADILLRRDVAALTLLGNRRKIEEQASVLGVDISHAQIVDPSESDWREGFACAYYELRKHKGMTLELARETMLDVSYFGTMMVHKGLADAMVSGAVHTTGHTIRPALEFIRTRPGCSIVSSVFFMCLSDRVLVYGDCAVVPNPTAEQLADIAVTSAETARRFDIEPRVAMLSYSSGSSGSGEDVDRVREATRIAKLRRPDLPIDGPIQYDAAVDASVGKQKMPGSEVAGHANVFVFPDLNTGNNTYKAVQRTAGAVAIGPVLQGLNKPVNDLSRGCTVTDIVNTVAITAVQAQVAESTPSREARP